MTAITPTKAGEGKTTTSVSLTQGMGAIGEQALLCLREASLGPVFGIKGGAAGAGYAQVVPMEDLNLHFTGDMHAISAANNLLAAFVDAHVMHGNELDIDPHSISWRRCVDMNDRGLRQIITGLGGATNGSPRETGFDITAASEVMAILALARDLTDLRQRLGSITVAYSRAGDPVTAEDIGCAGSMTVLLKDAIMPNLVQTLEGQPAFVHCGPFANIAHGNSSLIADRIALKMADYVITESGFGADMGMQKFMDIVCRQGGIRPAAVVVVATVKALRVHGGSPDGTATSPEESLQQLRAGIANLAAHIRTVQGYGVPCVVAVNRFPNDTDEECELVRTLALEAGAMDAQHNTAVADGGAGAADLARAVVKAAELAQRLQAHLSGRGLDRGEDRRDRDQGLRRRRRRVPARRARQAQALRGARLRPLADLHGQDAPLDLARPERPGRTERLHGADPRPARLYRRRFRDGALRHDRADAGAGQDPRGPQHRHRRAGPDSRALLRSAPVPGAFGGKLPPWGTQSLVYLFNHPSVDRAERIDLSRLLELARWLDPQISTDAEHSSRVSRVAIELADAAGLDGTGVAQTTLAGLLHDIGKIIVPRAVLLEPGRLDASEYDTIKRHPTASAQLAERAALPGIAAHPAPSPRALGRRRLPVRALGREHSARLARPRHRRRLRRDAGRPAVPQLDDRARKRAGSSRREREPSSIRCWSRRSCAAGSVIRLDCLVARRPSSRSPPDRLAAGLVQLGECQRSAFGAGSQQCSSEGLASQRGAAACRDVLGQEPRLLEQRRRVAQYDRGDAPRFAFVATAATRLEDRVERRDVALGGRQQLRAQIARACPLGAQRSIRGERAGLLDQEPPPALRWSKGRFLRRARALPRRGSRRAARRRPVSCALHGLGVADGIGDAFGRDEQHPAVWPKAGAAREFAALRVAHQRAQPGQRSGTAVAGDDAHTPPGPAWPRATLRRRSRRSRAGRSGASAGGMRGRGAVEARHARAGSVDHDRPDSGDRRGGAGRVRGLDAERECGRVWWQAKRIAADAKAPTPIWQSTTSKGSPACSATSAKIVQYPSETHCETGSDES